MITRGYDGTVAVDELLDFAERSVFGLAQGKLDRSFTPVNQIIKESLDVVDRLSKRKERVTGVPTGYLDLDDLTSGLQPSDLIVIAGRPSMGKTSLALGMAQHAALRAGTVVGIFSLEMSKPQLVLRMLAPRHASIRMPFGPGGCRKKTGGGWLKRRGNSNRLRFTSMIRVPSPCNRCGERRGA